MPIKTITKSNRVMLVDAGTHPNDAITDHALTLDSYGTKATDPNTGNVWVWSGTLWFQTHAAGVELKAETNIVPKAKSKQTLFTFLSDSGTPPTGNFNMTGDYSATTGQFYIKPAASEIIIIRSMTIHLRDSGNLDAGSYGNNITLANGIRVVMATGNDLTNEIIDFFQGTTVKTNGDWGKFGANITTTDFGTGDNFMSVSYSFPEPIQVHGDLAHTIGFKLNDDFTGLIEHTVFLDATKYTL